EALVARSEANLAAVAAWVASSDWAGFLPEVAETRSSTSICLKILDPWFSGQPREAQASVIKALVARLEGEAVAYDIGGYRDAPPGLRIWGGATVETTDIEALLPWLDWAYAATKGESRAAA